MTRPSAASTPETATPSRTSTPAARAAGEQAGVQRLPPGREAGPGRAAVEPPENTVPSGAVSVHPEQRLRAQRAHVIVGAHRREQPPRLGGDAFAADLVPREARLVEEQHVVTALAEEDGGGGAGGTAAHDHDVARGRTASSGRRAPPPRSADRATSAGSAPPGMPAAAKASASSGVGNARRIEIRPSATLTGERKSDA